ARARRGRHRSDVLGGEAPLAAVRADVAGELPDQRGLPRAVRPDDRVRLAEAHVEIDAVARAQRAEALAQGPDLEDVNHSCAAPGRQGRAGKKAPRARAAARG